MDKDETIRTLNQNLKRSGEIIAELVKENVNLLQKNKTLEIMLKFQLDRSED